MGAKYEDDISDDELMLIAKGHKVQTQMHMSFAEGGLLTQRCDPLKITRSVWTPKTKGGYGTPEVTWFVDGDETGHESLVDALRSGWRLGHYKRVVGDDESEAIA